MSRIETLPLKRLTRNQLLDRFIGLPLRLRWAMGHRGRRPHARPEQPVGPSLQRVAVSVNDLAHQAAALLGGGSRSDVPTLHFGSGPMSADNALASIQRDTTVIAQNLSGGSAATLSSPDGRRLVSRLRSVTRDLESEIALLGARSF